MGTETEGVWDGWEERVMSRVHKGYIQPGMMGMQERTDALIERLDILELSHRSSSTRGESLFPKVEDFLEKFSGSTEVQLAALSKAWVR